MLDPMGYFATTPSACPPRNAGIREIGAGTGVASAPAMTLSTSPSITRDVAAYQAAPSGKRLLLAEDDDELRDLFGRALRRADYAVLAASGGSGMLRMFSTVSRGELPTPDAIVMDVRMPEHSGLALLRALRLAEWRLPVLLVTGHPDEQIVERANAYGVATVLAKPVSAASLCSAVREAIAGARLLASLSSALR
jgi:CheY-like chemotaxis protein